MQTRVEPLGGLVPTWAADCVLSRCLTHAALFTRAASTIVLCYLAVAQSQAPRVSLALVLYLSLSPANQPSSKAWSPAACLQLTTWLALPQSSNLTFIQPLLFRQCISVVSPQIVLMPGKDVLYPCPRRLSWPHLLKTLQSH